MYNKIGLPIENNLIYFIKLMKTINGNGISAKETNGKLFSLLNDKLLNQTEDEAKIKVISHHFKHIMLALGLDLEDDSLKGTPERVARMYVKEIFGGLNPLNKPVITLFENKYSYKEMLLVKNIAVYSCCEHHFVPIIGHAHVAYFSSGKIIGLSKINRLVQYYCRRPQVQERLTGQIAQALKEVLLTEDVALVIEANHHCVAARGIKDVNSATTSSHFSGKFKQGEIRNEFLSFLK
jgi:GTP cyclohydrolase IA